MFDDNYKPLIYNILMSKFEKLLLNQANFYTQFYTHRVS